MRMLLNVATCVAIVVVAYSTAQAAVTAIKNSANFDFKYEMTVAPENDDQGPGGGNGIADWQSPAGTPNGGAWTHNAGAGTLSYDTSTNQATYTNAWYDEGGATEPWKNVITYADGYTIEVNVHVSSDAGSNPTGITVFNAGFEVDAFPAGNPDMNRAILAVGTGATYWNTQGNDLGGSPITGAEILDTNDNSDGFHVFRFAKEAGTAYPPVYSAWRDGVLLSETIGPIQMSSAFNILEFGDASGAIRGAAEIDYFRFTPGAFAPIPEPSTLVILTSSLLALGLVRRRNRR